jgi:hypothetical protein
MAQDIFLTERDELNHARRGEQLNLAIVRQLSASDTLNAGVWLEIVNQSNGHAMDSKGITEPTGSADRLHKFGRAKR